MLVIVAAIVLALASPKFTAPIRDAFDGQTEAVATENVDEGAPAKRARKREPEEDRAAARPTPTPRPTGTRTQQLSRRLIALDEQLRSTTLPKRSTEYQQLERERTQVGAAYAEERRRERRRDERP